MKRDEIDRRLAQIQTQSKFATDNLLELHELTTFKRLRGDDGWPKEALSGLTGERVAKALAALDRIWQNIPLLNDALKRAAKLRDSVWLVASESKLNELQQLLEGASIRLPPVETPLALRTLTAAAQTVESITLEQLQASMATDFEAAKAVILAVDRAWDRMSDILAGYDNEASALLHAPGSFAAREDADMLRSVREKIALLHKQIQADPLHVENEITANIAPVLKQLHMQGEQLLVCRKQIEIELARARELLKELKEANAESEKSYAECRLKIEQPQGLRAPLDSALISDLGNWLDKLNTHTDWRPLRVAIGRWTESASSHISSERTAIAANQAPLNVRAELRGRLAALCVKARTYAARGVVLNPDLAQLASEAERVLKTRPTSLPMGAKLVYAYETQLAKCLGHGTK